MSRTEAALRARPVGALLREGASTLAGAGLPTARRDAAWLLAGLLGLPRWRLDLEPDRPVDRETRDRFLGLVRRRRRWEPLQYLLGWEEFRGLRFRVDWAVLIPRPETELLVEWAAELLWQRRAVTREGIPGDSATVVDLGTGSGAIAVALARACPGTLIYATDLSPAAVALARANAASLGLAERVRVLEGDLFAPLRPLAGAVDLIISNPPYIPSGAIAGLSAEVRDWEPLGALDGGPDGMAVHRGIIACAPRFLRRGGWLLLEMGEDHSGELARLLAREGFQDVRVRKDLAGIQRMIGARRVGWDAAGGAGDGAWDAAGGAGDGARGAASGAGDGARGAASRAGGGA